MISSDQLTRENPLNQVYQCKRLFSYLREAAKLRLEIAPYECDREFEMSGGTVLYAVDANIIHLYVSPSRLGPSSPDRKRRGYGVVFDDDDDERAAALAAALSHFIFWRLSGRSRPLAVLIGHDAESRSILDLLSEQLGDDLNNLGAEADRLAMHRWLDEFGKKLVQFSSPEDRLNLLRSELPSISRHLFYDTGPAAEFLRYSELMREGRIQRLGSLIDAPGYLSDGRQKSEASRKDFAVPTSRQDFAMESQLRVDWDERILKDKPVRGAMARRADSAALARLELINRRVEKHGFKLVLITADAALFRSASKHYPIASLDQSFADLYLRHPRAFLSTRNLFSSREGEPSPLEAVVEWLDVLLAKYSADSLSLRELRQLRDASRESLVGTQKHVVATIRREPEAPDQIRKQWIAHLKSLADQSLLANFDIGPALSKILAAQTAGVVKSSLADFGKYIAVRTGKTWDALLETVSRVGLDLSWVDYTDTIYRRQNAPLLMFDAFPAASKFCKLVLTAGQISKVDSDQSEKLLNEIEVQDGTGYARTLAFGVLFAHSGRWHVCALLAARAIHIANSVAAHRSGEVSDHGVDRAGASVISGREACFLSAVALRFKARRVADLDGIEKLLDDCAEREKWDRSRNPALTPSTSRFASERISLQAARFYFAYFYPSGDSKPESEQLAQMETELLRDIDELISSCVHQIDQFLTRIVATTALTNLFMIHACGNSEAGKSHRDAIARGNTPTFLGLIDGTSENVDYQLTPTWISRAASWYARLYFGDADSRAARSIEREIQVFKRVALEKPKLIYLAPYDEERFALLIRLAQERIATICSH